jgi:cell division protein FtsB
MTGPTAHRTFDSWLRSLSPQEQDSVLGAQRLGAAFRAGKLSSVKQLVDAATGRPLTFGEMHEAGLLGPRWRGKDTWGAYGSVNELAEAIVADLKDPEGEVAKLNARIEELESQRIDLDIERSNHYSGDVPLSADDLQALEDRIAAMRTRIKKLKEDEQLYIARKYLYDLTPGKANFGDRIDFSNLEGVHLQAAQTGADVFANMIGSGTHLEQMFRKTIEGKFWKDVPEVGPYPSQTFADKWFKKAGKPKLLFAMARGNSNFEGGGPLGTLEIGDPTALDVVHEMGHWFESTSSKVVGKVIEYLKYRIWPKEWGTPEPYLHTPTWKAEYPRSVTHFIRDYQGAVYAGGGAWENPAVTEFVSKGLELLVFNTRELIENDLETFQFLCYLLTGRADRFSL